MEKEKTEPPKQQPSQQAARQERSGNLAELERGLPRMIELAQDLQKRLNATNPETVLPADLEREARELEQVAHRIHKRIRHL